MNIKRIFCLHKYKRTSKKPPMIPRDGSFCSYGIELTCKKCGRIKNSHSGAILGMTIDTKSLEREERLKKILDK